MRRKGVAGFFTLEFIFIDLCYILFLEKLYLIIKNFE